MANRDSHGRLSPPLEGRMWKGDRWIQNTTKQEVERSSKMALQQREKNLDFRGRHTQSSVGRGGGGGYVHYEWTT